MSYNKDIDYQEKINEAVKIGDYESAAQYEKSRNEKIDGENLDYKKTNRFSGWLDDTDYSLVLRDQMQSGTSRKTVAETLGKRVNKASGTQGLTQYAKDDVYDAAIRYIMGEGGFVYSERMPVYQGKYDGKIDSLFKSISNPKKFSYNPFDDDLYKYYEKAYLREGERAMEDTLGKLATNTGGVASSYAASAAAQSRNYYNEKLTDKIPELYMDAYERYLDDIGIKKDALEVLLDMRDADYEVFEDSIEQYNKDREFEYEKFTDDRDYEKYLREEERKDEEFEYKKFTDNRDYEKYQDEQKREDEEKANDEHWAQVDLALEKWEKLGYLDEESAKILGLPAGLHTTDFDYKKAQQYKIYNK